MVLGTYDYPTSHRLFEFASVGAFLGFAGALTWRVAAEVFSRLSVPVGFRDPVSVVQNDMVAIQVTPANASIVTAFAT